METRDAVEARGESTEKDGTVTHVVTLTPRSPAKAKLAERIYRDFTYHAPKPDQIPRYNELREKAKLLALRMIDLCPESRELSLALTHLEEAVMEANAAIARNE